MIVILGFALLIGSPALAKNDKVQLCHVPPGNPANAHEISVSPNAVDGHLLNHTGDALGPCAAPVVCPCWTAAEVQAALAAADASDDVSVHYCELDVDILHGYFDAELTFEDMEGDDVYLYVDFEADDEAEYNRCEVEEYGDLGLDLGLEEISVDGLSAEQASECASILGKVCLGLLP